MLTINCAWSISNKWTTINDVFYYIVLYAFTIKSRCAHPFLFFDHHWSFFFFFFRFYLCRCRLDRLSCPVCAPVSFFRSVDLFAHVFFIIRFPIWFPHRFGQIRFKWPGKEFSKLCPTETHLMPHSVFSTELWMLVCLLVGCIVCNMCLNSDASVFCAAGQEFFLTSQKFCSMAKRIFGRNSHTHAPMLQMSLIELKAMGIHIYKNTTISRCQFALKMAIRFQFLYLSHTHTQTESNTSFIHFFVLHHFQHSVDSCSVSVTFARLIDLFVCDSLVCFWFYSFDFTTTLNFLCVCQTISIRIWH